MCRLFGSRSRSATGVAHDLLHASNALRVQSRQHPDGWGVAWYEEGTPRVARSLTPAHGDGEFEQISSFVHAPTVVAHVRLASVGRVAPENTHPFVHGPWVFAHNGTVPQWESARPRLVESIAPALRPQVRGETDSEHCFFLFLSRLAARCDPARADARSAAEALRETVALVRRAAETPEKPASTTFLATDGRLLLACRRGRTLHLSAPEPDARGGREYIALASEDLGTPAPSGRRAWVPLDEGALVVVTPELELRVESL